MGLDAHVFKGRDAIARDFPGVEFQFEPETGEPSPVDESINLSLVERCAATYRVGNISGVCAIRDIAEGFLPANSVTIERVLWSGSHAGDHIPRELLPSFFQELTVLETSQDPFVQEFGREMKAILAVANKERTTICF